MTVKVTRPIQRLTAIIDLPGGRTKSAALEAAHGGIRGMKDQVAEVLRQKLRDIILALTPDDPGRTDPSGPQRAFRLDQAYRKADEVNGLAGMIGLGQVGEVMLLLCDLLQPAGARGRVHPMAVETYRLCARRMEPLTGLGDLTGVTSALRSLNAACAGRAGDFELPANPICQFVYASVSTLRGDAFEDATAGILEHAIARNHKLGLTGMLAADDGWYLQCVQGSPEAVAVLVDALLFDRRHCAMRTISARLTPERSFAEWGVCFRRLSPLHEAILAHTRGKLALQNLGETAALDLLQTIAATARLAQPSPTSKL